MKDLNSLLLKINSKIAKQFIMNKKTNISSLKKGIKPFIFNNIINSLDKSAIKFIKKKFYIYPFHSSLQ